MHSLDVHGAAFRGYFPSGTALLTQGVTHTSSTGSLILIMRPGHSLEVEPPTTKGSAAFDSEFFQYLDQPRMTFTELQREYGCSAFHPGSALA